MKTIKIIDLLIKIANGELPNGTEIRAEKGLSYCWFKFYRHQELFNNEQIKKMIDLVGLNGKVEIIEEDKKIEKLPKHITDNACASKDFREVANKINELIDAVNELKGGKNDR